MGLYPQPNDWTCGPFALKHALAILGRVADEDTIKAKAHSHWWTGTDELGLAMAAAHYDCRLDNVRARTPEKARSRLLQQLRNKHPVLLCVDGWAHWVAVVRNEGEHFVVIDSNEDPVLCVLTWHQLEKRWRYLDRDYDEEDPPLLYDLNPVVPQFRVKVRADVSVARVRHLRRASHQHLAEHWTTYLEDLLEICHVPNPNLGEPLSMAELLRRNQDLIVKRVRFWHGDVAEGVLSGLLSDYRFVAETYGLVIPKAKVRRAVTDLVILTTFWAALHGGLGEMFGVRPP